MISCLSKCPFNQTSTFGTMVTENGCRDVMSFQHANAAAPFPGCLNLSGINIFYLIDSRVNDRHGFSTLAKTEVLEVEQNIDKIPKFCTC